MVLSDCKLLVPVLKTSNSHGISNKNQIHNKSKFN